MADVAVVGAGIMGSATAYALAREGRDVTLYEQFEVGHTRGSSHGRSRIVRLAYPDLEFVELARESFAVVQPEAGIVRADKALSVFARGLDVRENTKAHPGEVEADAVVVTAGSWVNELLDEPLDVKVTRETLCYFRPDSGGRPIPSVVSFKPDGHTHDLYSLADPKHGLKAGVHHAGTEADPNVPGEPEPELIERITAWARRTYRLADPDPVAAETCIYTTTPDHTFVLDRRGRAVVGSACSGHGFKFAPAVGRRLAALALAG